MIIRKSRKGGFMATKTLKTPTGPIQVAGFGPSRIIALYKCIETIRILNAN